MSAQNRYAGRSFEDQERYKKEWAGFRDEVKRRAYGNWDQVLMALGGSRLGPALDAQGRHVACPIHGGTDGFRVFKDFRLTGGSICNTCHDPKFPNTDGFATLQFVNGWTFGETIKAVAEVLGIAVPGGRDESSGVPAPNVFPIVEVVKESPEEVRRKDEYKAKRLVEAWSEAFAITDPRADVLRTYLRLRGITEAVGPLDDLRLHPGMPYFENKVNLGEYPTFLSLLRQPSGAPLTLQRVYLTPAGLKAPVDSQKKIMQYRSTSQYNGSAVRLDHDVGSVLCVAEGVETALAWRAMVGLPTWASCVAGLLETMVLPDSVQLVLIAADRDLPTRLTPKGRGLAAAETLAERVRATGRKAAVFIPPFGNDPNEPKKIDWNDVLASFGLQAARKESFITGARWAVRQQLKSFGLKWESANAHY